MRHDPDRVIAYTGGGGLTLEDRAEALHVRAVLPEIPAAERALADVRAGRLRGFSIEFRATEERRESGIRVVSSADLSGIGLVAAPSYRQSSVELRARSGRTFRASIPANKNLACRCSGVGCKFARFQRESLQDMWDETWGEFEKWAAKQTGPRPPEVVAAFGSYDMPLASIGAGTLRGRMRGDDLEVEIDLPEGAAGAAATAAHDAAGVIVRPFIDADAAESTLQGGDAGIHARAAAGRAGERDGPARGLAGGRGDPDAGLGNRERGSAPPTATGGGMAVVCLSPVPTTPAKLTAARNYLAAQIGGSGPKDMVGPGGRPVARPELVERIDALIAIAAALIEKEAPNAPQAVKNEACVRMCGYLAEGYSATVRSETIGPKSAEYNLNHAAMFRTCGAKGLLAPFKVRRAGRIG